MTNNLMTKLSVALCTLMLVASFPVSAVPATKSGAAPLTTANYFHRPKLVVVLVIDQFRADYLTRFESRFLPAGSKKKWGGFNYLMHQGAYFPFAEYGVLQNMTCPGHATILTGAPPYAHHIPLNDWFDEKSHKDVYCVDDEEAPLIPIVAGGKTSPGVSPRHLDASTVGDELKGSGLQNKVIALALKDRASVMLGGRHADLAIWFDQKDSGWQTSRFYAPELPGWVTALNAAIKPRLFKNNEWTGVDETGLSNPYDKGTFKRESSYGSSESLRTPVGVALTTEAAIAALHAYKLGANKASPDLLAVSYSSHDMLGHKVGPNAREMEELTIAEDASLAELFNAIEKSVPGGLKETLITLTGDHGMAPSPAFSITSKFESAAIERNELQKKMNAELDKKFGANPRGWIYGVRSFNFYLDHETILAQKLDVTNVENALRELLLREKETETVITLTDYRTHHLPAGVTGQQALNSFVPGINGDVLLIPKPYYMEEEEPVTHMTGYSYDRSVPLVLAGPNLKAGTYATAAHVIDLAPTISFLTGVLPPNKSEGRVLSEAIGN